MANIKIIFFKSPGWCSSVDWARVCKPKGHQFDSQSGHMPGFPTRSLVGGVWEASLLRVPYGGPGPQPRHVPWLGIKLETLWFAGWHSIHWATPARATFLIFISDLWEYYYIPFAFFKTKSLLECLLGRHVWKLRERQCGPLGTMNNSFGAWFYLLSFFRILKWAQLDF